MGVFRTRVDAAMKLLPAVDCAFLLPAARGAVLQLIQLSVACVACDQGVRKSLWLLHSPLSLLPSGALATLTRSLIMLLFGARDLCIYKHPFGCFQLRGVFQYHEHFDVLQLCIHSDVAL